MPFTFSPAQVKLIKDLRGTRDAGDPNVDFADVYLLIVSMIENSPDPNVQVVEAFLRGAAQVNEGTGNFSEMIRGYTRRQLELRAGSVPDALTLEQDMQRASNRIAAAIVLDIESNSVLPTIDEIADIDATSAVTEVFDDYISPTDTAVTSPAAWAGAPFFSHFNNNEMGRLISAGNPVLVDTLDDMRNALFALDSMHVGQWSQTADGFRDSFLADRSVLWETVSSSDFWGPFFWTIKNDGIHGSLSEFFDAVKRPTYSAALLSQFAEAGSEPFDQLSKLFVRMGQLGQGSVLDQIRGSYEGRAYGETTTETFLPAARNFFLSLTPAQLQSIGAESLTEMGRAELVNAAQTADRYRNALRGLSQFALELPSYTGRGLDLYNPQTGQGNLTCAAPPDLHVFCV